MCEYNIHWALYNAALSVWNGSQLQRWLSEYRFTQPQDAPKVVFLETHDTRLLTPPAQRLRGSAVTEALMDLAVFAGCQPMIWYDELERRESYYTGLLALRAELGGALEGWADTEAVTTDQPNVFAAARAGNAACSCWKTSAAIPPERIFPALPPSSAWIRRNRTVRK